MLAAPEEFVIHYNDSFDIRDKYSELNLIIQAKAAGYTNPTYIKELDKQLAALMIEDTKVLNNLMEAIEEPEEFVPHIMYDPDTGDQQEAKTEADHIRLAAEGYVHLGE